MRMRRKYLISIICIFILSGCGKTDSNTVDNTTSTDIGTTEEREVSESTTEMTVSETELKSESGTDAVEESLEYNYELNGFQFSIPSTWQIKSESLESTPFSVSFKWDNNEKNIALITYNENLEVLKENSGDYSFDELIEKASVADSSNYEVTKKSWVNDRFDYFDQYFTYSYEDDNREGRQIIIPLNKQGDYISIIIMGNELNYDEMDIVLSSINIETDFDNDYSEDVEFNEDKTNQNVEKSTRGFDASEDNILLAIQNMIETNGSNCNYEKNNSETSIYTISSEGSPVCVVGFTEYNDNIPKQYSISVGDISKTDSTKLSIAVSALIMTADKSKDFNASLDMFIDLLDGADAKKPDEYEITQNGVKYIILIGQIEGSSETSMYITMTSIE